MTQPQNKDILVFPVASLTGNGTQFFRNSTARY